MARCKTCGKQTVDLRCGECVEQQGKTNSLDRLLVEVSKHYGYEHQKEKTQEELKELLTALESEDEEGIAEEVADVLNMVHQICRLKGISEHELLYRRLLKMNREWMRIKSK